MTEPLRIVPSTIREARIFVARHHRHHAAPVGGLFALAAARGPDVVAVAIVGRPVARALQDGRTAEVTRLCAVGGLASRNACSMLYAAARGPDVVAVAIVGRPVARALQDGRTAEVTRLCAVGGLASRNACSMLYAAAWRAARALGWARLVTYILDTEEGVTLRAAGWHCVGEAGGGSWSRPSRVRVSGAPEQRKLRWEVAA